MRNEAGFSMIAVLVAIVLLTVGVMSVSRASGEVFRAHTVAGTRTAAVAIARGHMEVVRSQDPTDLASQAAVRVNERGEVDPNGVYARSVTVEEVRHNLVRIRVVVEFPRSQRPVELETFAFVGSR